MIHLLLMDPLPLLVSWMLAALVVVVEPVLRWRRHRYDYYNSYGAAIEYDQAQRAYDEAQRNNNGDNNNNNNDANGFYDANGDFHTFRSCAWWQFACRRQQTAYRTYLEQQDNANDQQDDEFDFASSTPSWYRFLGGTTEDDRRWQEEQGLRQEGQIEDDAIKFVYIWTMLLFLGAIVYGVMMFWHLYRIRARTNGNAVTFPGASFHYTALLIWLLLLGQFAIMTMILLCQGVILTDDRDLENSVYGWYGQWSVLLVYSNCWYVLFSLAFAIVLAIRVAREPRPPITYTSPLAACQESAAAPVKRLEPDNDPAEAEYSSIT